MSTTTAYYDLIKPESTDVADITLINENWDKIDEELNNRIKANAQRFSISQIDDMKTPGWYFCIDMIDMDYGNFPEKAYGNTFMLEVNPGMNANKVYVTQTAYIHENRTTPLVLTRMLGETGWEDWRDVSANAFAPSGYGLGVMIPFVSDLDNITMTGFFGWGTDAVNAPFEYGSLIAVRRNNRLTQIAIDPNMGENGAIAIRHHSGTSWSAWAYLNPRMLNGVEYKTSEVYKGEIVYAKRVTYTTTGALGTEGSVSMVDIPHGISNFDKLVRCVGKNESANYMLPYMTNDGILTLVNGVNTTNIRMRLESQAWSGNNTWAFDVYYTKKST